MGIRGGNVHGAEAPANLASVTPTTREATRGASMRQRQQQQQQKQNDTDCTLDTDVKHNDQMVNKVPHQSSNRNSFNGSVNNNSYMNGGVILGVNGVGGVLCPDVMIGCNDNKYKGGVESYLKTSDKLKIDKSKCETGSKFVEKIRSVQDAMYKQHDITKVKNETVISHVGYKNDNLKYYGFKSYGAIDKPPSSSHHHNHHHQYASSEKAGNSGHHEKIHARSLQGYPSKTSGDKSVYSDKYNNHRSGYSKSANAFPVYQETKYAISVSGVPGTPAQANAAAAFFAR